MMNNETRFYFALFVKTEKGYNDFQFVQHLNKQLFSKLELDQLTVLSEIRLREKPTEIGLYICKYNLAEEICELSHFNSKLDTKTVFGENLKTVEESMFKFMGMAEYMAEPAPIKPETVPKKQSPRRRSRSRHDEVLKGMNCGATSKYVNQ